MFPATVEIVRRLRPKAFVVENVKGLTRSSFANYYQYIQYQLEFPELPRRSNEDWYQHFLRLQGEHTSGREHGRGLTYRVAPTLVNAANYGVPQKRERVFIVGFRADLDVDWKFPSASHSQDSLFYDQWVTGEYWERNRVPKDRRPTLSASIPARILNMRDMFTAERLRPWRTVREALADLPDPESKAARGYADHRFQPGARSYPGHTGSPLDLPAKTLKAGDHGVPGGENMMVRDDGSVRYFTVRESARLQTFPDGYVFHGSWTETMRQLGNAVPVALAQRVIGSVAEELVLADVRRLGLNVSALQEAGRPPRALRRTKAKRSAA
jgi:DNA (cytosine-5)-methyltransferase 1